MRIDARSTDHVSILTLSVSCPMTSGKIMLKGVVGWPRMPWNTLRSTYVYPYQEVASYDMASPLKT
jgi:hypothetical protein